MTLVEVKVSRSDFLAEVRNPLKQERWLRHAHRAYYATPKDLVRVEEIPVGWGLIEVAAPHP